MRTDSGEVSGQIHYCFVTGNIAGLVTHQLSQSELAGHSEQVALIVNDITMLCDQPTAVDFCFICLEKL